MLASARTSPVSTSIAMAAPELQRLRASSLVKDEAFSSELSCKALSSLLYLDVRESMLSYSV